MTSAERKQAWIDARTIAKAKVSKMTRKELMALALAAQTQREYTNIYLKARAKDRGA